MVNYVIVLVSTISVAKHSRALSLPTHLSAIPTGKSGKFCEIAVLPENIVAMATSLIRNECSLGIVVFSLRQMFHIKKLRILISRHSITLIRLIIGIQELKEIH